MARTIERLTVRKVGALSKPGMHADGGSLYLRVGPSGSKSWVFRYRENGRLHDLGIGPLRTVDLFQARERARALRLQRLDGGDPLRARQEAKQASRIERAKTITFADAAGRYVATHAAAWRSTRSRTQWEQSFADYANPVLGDLPVAAIDTGLVMRVLEPIWTTKAETASRLRARIENVLSWATTAGYRSGENPARWRGHLDNLLPKPSRISKVEHHAAMPYVAVPAFMAELQRLPALSALALRLLILTAARTREVAEAKWSEIDLEGRLWTIPGERMKSGREHRVPLSTAAVRLLSTHREYFDGEFVFPGRSGRGLSHATLRAFLRQIGRGDLTVHGFRSTFRDWAAERTNFPREVAEMALAHSVGSAVEQAYRRGDMFDKRRQLAEAWARYCYSPAGAGAEVVGIRGRTVNGGTTYITLDV